MPIEVGLSPEASDDLLKLYLFIAERAGSDRALAYLERLEQYCLSFSTFPERGTARDDLMPGLRIAGFERNVTVAFHLSPGKVTFDRIFYGGRDFESLFDQG